MLEDFNPNESYQHNPIKEDWDFANREEEINRAYDNGLIHKSRVTQGISKQHPK